MSYTWTPGDDGWSYLPAQSPLRVAVLISGSGTTLRNLLQRIDDQQLDVEVRCVISSSSQAKGLQFAEQADIPSYVRIQSRYDSAEAYSAAIFDICRQHDVSIVVMGGFLKHVLIPADFANRVVNIHPSLIPAFCGQGFYGARVHQAVLDYGCKISGCTVHFVDNEYDHGPILLQRTVPVDPEDTPATLAARVFEQECEAYPKVLQVIAAGNVAVRNRKVRVRVD